MVLASLTNCKRNYSKFMLPSLFLSKITAKLKGMKQHILTTLIFLISFGQSQIVYKVPIHDTIDLGLPPFIERSIEMAEEDNAKAIIFDIDTFGGRLDAATQIKDAIPVSYTHLRAHET